MSVQKVENTRKKKGEMDFFVYQWSVEEDNDSTLIRAYGITQDNKTLYVRIDDFTPYCYIELPSEMEWTESRIELVSNRLSTLNQKLFQPVKRQFVYRRKLYYAWKNKQNKHSIHTNQSNQTVEKDKIETTPKYTDRQFPFLFFAFRSTAALQTFTYSMKKDIEIPGLGVMKFSLHENERGVSPVLKLQASKKLPSAGMIRVEGISIPEYERESNCDYEISCSYENLFALESSDILEPRVISFDIEANSTITSAMPDASRPNDKVFQIGFASLVQKKRRKYLFSLGNPDHSIVGQEVELRTFKTEADLLVALTEFIREEKFNVVIGYNILGWDFQYMISRAKYTKCFTEFSLMGKLQGKSAKEVAPQFESKAFNAQKLVYLDAEGILFLDLLPIIKRSGEKLTNHRLSTVLEYFNLPSKDPLTARDIFRCYREFTPSSLGEVGKYCVQDAYATLLLYEKMQTWFGLCEMAKTAHVPIFSLFSQGTQIQMFSQVMEYCMYNNYVIISNGYTIKEGDDYMGAIVLTPVPGKYKKVISFDFASLYPSIMMSHNIDYSTLVPEGEMYLVDTYDTEEYLSHWHHFPCFTKVSYIDMFNPQNNREEWSSVRNRSELQTRVETMKEKYPFTLVGIFKDRSEIPDEDCHVFCWADHSNCKHDENRRRLKNGEFSKSKAMKVICGQRYYRFMKAEAGGKGVVPILLESLISRRRDTRAQIKKNTLEMRTHLIKLVSAVKRDNDNFKNVEEFLEEFEKREKDLFCDLERVECQLKVEECLEIISRIESLETSNHILDKRQASYKVCANSMYGAMGVKKGYLPLLPGASSITYKGRRSIEFISTYIPEKYGGVTVYGDSVTGDTPIMIRYSNGTIDIRPIEDLGINWEKTYRSDDSIEKEHSSCGNVEVWVDGKWSKVRRVIRHETDKKIYRVLTNTGCVDVTEDHSLLTYNGVEIKPSDVKLNTRLLHSFPHVFEEFVFLSKDEYIEEGDSIKLKSGNRHESSNKLLQSSEFKDQLEDEAFVWGLFMAEGSCETYYCDSGNKHKWAIYNEDYKLLERCQNILTEREGYEFKILNPIDGGTVYKLVPIGCTKHMVIKYRTLFYHGKEQKYSDVDGDKSYKVVPYIIFNSSREIQKKFFEGLYTGIGEKNESGNFTFKCKGKIGSQGIFYLARALGYKYISVDNVVSENKEESYTITGSIERYNKTDDEVKNIHIFKKNYNRLVYDLETEEGAFHAGVGCLIVKNTDSSHIYFPHLKNNEEAVELAERIVDEIQQFFPKPMKLEFEKIYEKYIILTKKRYMTRVANKKGEIIEFIKKGVMLSRRDNCEFARKMYLKASESLLDDVSESTILTDIVDGINTLFQRSFGFKSFVITKAMARAEYKNKTLPAHVQLAYKMRTRGIEVPVGARVEYIFTTRCIGEKNFAQGDKVEDLDYFSQWRQFLRVDYLYYLEKQLIKPLDELLFVGLGVKNFVNTQYNLRMCKWETLEKIKDIFSPDIRFEDENCLNDEKIATKKVKGYPKTSVKNLKNVVKRKRLPKRAEIILDSDSGSESD
jgi:DNA polymerase elongation subunit (family B)